jgi:hypothetical protein
MEANLDSSVTEATAQHAAAPPPPPEPIAKARPARWRRPLDYYLLWMAVIASLAINAYLLQLVIEGQRQIGLAAGTAAEAVGELADASIEYNVEIRETIPVSLTVRYNDVVTVPISYTLPINTNVSVPLRTPLGTFPINFPVVASIGISLTPIVPINIVVPISHVVPIAIAVPIDIEMLDTPFGTALVEVEGYLHDVSVDLQDPTLPGWPFGPTPIP